MSTPSLCREPPSLHVALGGRDSPRLDLGLPILAGEGSDVVIPEAVFNGRRGPYDVFEAGPWLLGQAMAPEGMPLAEGVRMLYREMFRLAGGRQLARVWNYVPGINEPHPQARETYHLFCDARASAFREAWGPSCEIRVPAASAVGTDGPRLCIVFCAASARGWNVENPFQVPAYRYPGEYGPVSPSFARATVIEAGAGRRHVFLSGTAAIRGHATWAPSDTAGQIDCTLENLRRISEACGIGGDLGGASVSRRCLKVYLRAAADLFAVASALDAKLLRPGDLVSYVRADICRRELNLEIEASILGAAVQ